MGPATQAQKRFKQAIPQSPQEESPVIQEAEACAPLGRKYEFLRSPRVHN